MSKKINHLAKMTGFLDRLDGANIHYTLSSVTEGAVRIHIDTEDEHWVVDFEGDGEIDVRIFKGDDEVHEFSATEALFSEN